MKFVFPQNYNFKNKLFGFIDYTTAILNVLWYVFVFAVVDLLFIDLTFKIAVFIVFALPVFLFSLFGFNHENILYVITYMFMFIKRRRVYFYDKG
ncbi:MAG: hypothetical protein FWC68_00500 [Oscillospiraceae bacterium]|nr:hypothetical protein [Oscillospiraceae bacterium]